MKPRISTGASLRASTASVASWRRIRQRSPCSCLALSVRSEWFSLLSVELVIGPDIVFGEQIGDGDGPEAVACADDDLQRRGVADEDLATQPT